MIIAFPPCTHLAVSGARYFEVKRADGRQRDGIEFFCRILEADTDHLCVENPVNIITGKGDYVRRWFPDLAERYGLPVQCSQIVNPFEFGEDAAKKTCLWLKGLPLLKGTEFVPPHENGRYANQLESSQSKTFYHGRWLRYNDPLTGVLRSKTYPGIARAMAEQWREFY